MRGTAPFWINPEDDSYWFPDASLALEEPDGLLAVGGTLEPQRLLAAYPAGIFPWYNDDQPILWWSPNPRAVLFPERFVVSRSLRKCIKKNPFRVTADQAFAEVIYHCSEPRRDEAGTWISDNMLKAYVQLHQLGHAHSIECWQDEQLVGGLYGIAIGKMFFGESMFSRRPNASKVAFYYLAQNLIHWGYPLIDCQVSSAHLSSLGAELMARDRFLQLLKQYCSIEYQPGPWDLFIDSHN